MNERMSADCEDQVKECSLKGRFPAGCKITDIKRGKGARHEYIYAFLRDPDGKLLISASLDYITEQLYTAEID